MNFVFLVLLTVAFLAGAATTALTMFFGFRQTRQGATEAKRARKPRPPRCYVVEPTTIEEKSQRPRKRKHPPLEDEASGLMEPVRGVDIAV